VRNSDRSISTIHPSGIALAGIQALDAKGGIQDSQIAELKGQLDAESAEFRSLQERLARLETLLQRTTSGHAAH